MLLNDLVRVRGRVMLAGGFGFGEARDAEVELMARRVGAANADLE